MTQQEPVAERRDASAVGDAYLPLRALAGYSGLSVRTLRGYLSHASSPLPHYRIGGKVLVRRSEFDQWVEGFRVRVQAGVEDIVRDVLAGFQGG